MLYVAFDKLVRRAQQQMAAQQLRRRVDHGHRILQLVAEAIRAARLVIAAARPQTAGDGLVHQPAIGDHVQRRIGRFDAHGAQRALPVRAHRVERHAGRVLARMALHHGTGVGIAAPAHAEEEDDFALLPRLQFKRHLDRCARVQARARLAGQAHAP